MNKVELIDAIAKETGLSKKDSGKAVSRRRNSSRIL